MTAREGHAGVIHFGQGLRDNQQPHSPFYALLLGAHRHVVVALLGMDLSVSCAVIFDGWSMHCSRSF